MHNIYKKIEEYDPRKKLKVLIVFDDMIADMINNNRIKDQLNQSKNLLMTLTIEQ